MTAARLYVLVTFLHVAADLVFVGGLLVSTLLLFALAGQPAAGLAREQRLLAGLRRWNRVVTGPALVLAWAFGLWLAFTSGWIAAGWLHAKLALVLALSAAHGVTAKALRRAGTPPPVAPARAWRLAAPLCLLAVLVVVWLAVVKPF